MKSNDLKTAQINLRMSLAILNDKLTDRSGERVTDCGDLCEITNTLANASHELAFLEALAGMRGGHGSGDHGEASAIKQATAKRRNVRRALGFSIP